MWIPGNSIQNLPKVLCSYWKCFVYKQTGRPHTLGKRDEIMIVILSGRNSKLTNNQVRKEFSLKSESKVDTIHRLFGRKWTAVQQIKITQQTLLSKRHRNSSLKWPMKNITWDDGNWEKKLNHEFKIFIKENT